MIRPATPAAERDMHWQDQAGLRRLHPDYAISPIPEVAVDFLTMVDHQRREADCNG